MAITFIKHKTTEELDIEELQKQYEQYAQGKRSREITNINWRGTTGNPASDIMNGYTARVRVDGGIVEAWDCCHARIYQLIV